MHKPTSTLRIQLRRMSAWAFTHLPGLRQLWARVNRTVAQQHGIPWTPLRRPLNRCRIALITTGGVHLRTEPAFDMANPHGDASFRVIPATTPLADLMITHNYYDHHDADRDLNILLPLERLAELVAAGMVGSQATAYSFMGHITDEQLPILTGETAPAVVQLLHADAIDAVLLTPA